MNRFCRAFGAILTAALLAACSGGGANVGHSTGLLPSRSAHAFKTGFIRTRIHIPAPKKHAAHGRQRKPHWLPAAATEIDFTLLAVNGNQDGVNWCNVGQGSGCYDFQIYTQGSNAKGCISDGNGGLQCTVNEPAPAAADTYQIQAQYCGGKLNADGSCYSSDALELLSQSNSLINVPLNAAANGNFTLNPVVANLQWQATGIQVASGQPFATGAAPPNAVLQIQALDQYGDIIIGGTTDPSGTYNTALYLQWDGSVDPVVWNCTDPSVTFETGGGPYSDITGYKPLTAETLANGATDSSPPSLDFDHGFNSPESAPQNDYDGGHWGQGVDGNGNVVQGIGNNGIEINYDGSSPLDLSTEFDCNAYDAEGNQATIAVTLGDGSITWGTNAKHLSWKHHR